MHEYEENIIITMKTLLYIFILTENIIMFLRN